MADRPRLAIIQGICPHYRVPLFRRLAQHWDLRLFHGRGDRRGAWQNAKTIEGFAASRLFTLKLAARRIHPYLNLSWFPTLFFGLRRFRPDAIVTEGLTSFVNSLTAHAYARVAGIPVIVWDGGRRVGKKMPLVRRMLAPIDRFLLTRADAVIGYSSLAADYFRSLGIPDERIFVAQNTIDVESMLRDRESLLAAPQTRTETRESLGIAQEATVALYVGAIEERKRLDVLVDSLADLQQEGQAVALVVAGDGAHRPELERFVAERGVEDVHFLGRVTDGVGRYFVSADFFALPGPGGLSVNHAMAYGLPVIVWGGDGTERDLVVDGSTGFLADDESTFRDRVRLLAAGASNRDLMSEATLGRIRGFGLENMERQYSSAIAFARSSKGHCRADG